MRRLKTVANADELDLGLVVFDITGTVITNTGAVADAFVSALRANGVQISDEELQPWRGASKRMAIRNLVALHYRQCGRSAGVDRRLCQRQQGLQRIGLDTHGEMMCSI